MKIFLGSDHAGFEAKEEIKKILTNLNYEYVDLGPNSTSPVDYPIYAKLVCENVQKDFLNNRGILICGSGTGMQIVANKFKGIRAAFCYDEYSAKMSRKDNDSNVLTLRARNFDHKLYKNIVEVWLKTQFSGEDRHKNRIKQIESIENCKDNLLN